MSFLCPHLLTLAVHPGQTDARLPLLTLTVCSRDPRPGLRPRPLVTLALRCASAAVVAVRRALGGRPAACPGGVHLAGAEGGGCNCGCRAIVRYGITQSPNYHNYQITESPNYPITNVMPPPPPKETL